MDVKRAVLSLLAILSIVAACYGIWRWQERADSKPIRQEQEIR